MGAWIAVISSRQFYYHRRPPWTDSPRVGDRTENEPANRRVGRGTMWVLGVLGKEMQEETELIESPGVPKQREAGEAGGDSTPTLRARAGKVKEDPSRSRLEEQGEPTESLSGRPRITEPVGSPTTASSPMLNPPGVVGVHKFEAAGEEIPPEVDEALHDDGMKEARDNDSAGEIGDDRVSGGSWDSTLERAGMESEVDRLENHV